MRRFTLTSSAGIELTVLDYGATISDITAPDRTGRRENIVLGYPDCEQYRHGKAYFGAVVGRYANRIARGRFTLDGKTYQLATNDPPNHLHGGIIGFDKRIWQVDRGGDRSLRLEYTSVDGEEAYPGTVQVRVTYTLSGNELTATYEATTDKPTPINVTQHTYWNLAAGRRDILDHVLTIAAAHYTPVDDTQIPTGEIVPVAGTRFDFTRPRAIRGDYDHNWALGDGRWALADGRAAAGEALGDKRWASGERQEAVGEARGPLGDRRAASADGIGGPGERREPPADAREVPGDPHGTPRDDSRTLEDRLRFAARVADPESGRVVSVHTTEPGIQFYSGVLLPQKNWGLCLETQHFPDSPNHPQFPSTILRPREIFTSMTTWRFETLG